jgi:predicted nucleotidyltransferase component of viral defense system
MKELKALNDKTGKVLIKLSQYNFMQNYVLCGGSGLALYLNHRLSEDLDFFTNLPFEKTEVLDFVNNNFAGLNILLLKSNQIDVVLDNVNVTFCYQKNDLLNNKNQLIKYINIGTIDTIIIMKMLTVFLRAKFRDYYDLYYVTKKYNLEYLFRLGNEFIPNFSNKLFEKAIVFIKDIEDEDISYLKPKESVTKQDIMKFFVSKIKEMHINLSK